MMAPKKKPAFGGAKPFGPKKAVDPEVNPLFETAAQAHKAAGQKLKAAVIRHMKAGR